MKRRHMRRIKYLGHPWKFYDEGVLITQPPSKHSMNGRTSTQLEEIMQSFESRNFLSPEHYSATSAVSPISDLCEPEQPLENQVRYRNSHHSKYMVPKVNYQAASKPRLQQRDSSLGLPSVEEASRSKLYKKPWYLTPNKWKQVQVMDRDHRNSKMSVYRGKLYVASNTYKFLQAESQGPEQQKYSQLGQKLSKMPTVSRFKQ